VTWRRRGTRRNNLTGAPPNVGLFGLLGQGNLGNDGSLEALLAYLRRQHPEVTVDALCTGPDLIRAQYDLPTTDLHWHHSERRSNSSVTAFARKATDTALGMTIDSVRLARWVRRHDAVIVPGMGVLETTVPMRTWKTPYLMFLLSASGTFFGTKVALVSIGANVIDERFMRMLITAAARLAYYRSFRDRLSRDAMQRMGLDVSGDVVYPDVVFSLATRPTTRATPRSVGIGVMDYCGRNVDRRQADAIRSSYIEKITNFALWLVDNGRPIRLITSDPMADDKIIRAILSSLRARRPGLSHKQVVAEPIESMGDLMRQTALVESVVATRYHNIVCAMKLAKPTVSIGYAEKCEVLMADMGLSEFCQPVKSFDVVQLIEQFEELDHRAGDLRLMLTERSAERGAMVEDQFVELSDALFPAAEDPRRQGPLRLVQTGIS
jgi:polysaccharide pyruvyl transferase WcaK-like protein